MKETSGFVYLQNSSDLIYTIINCGWVCVCVNFKWVYHYQKQLTGYLMNSSSSFLFTFYTFKLFQTSYAIILKYISISTKCLEQVSYNEMNNIRKKK